MSENQDAALRAAMSQASSTSDNYGVATDYVRSKPNFCQTHWTCQACRLPQVYNHRYIGDSPTECCKCRAKIEFGTVEFLTVPLAGALQDAEERGRASERREHIETMSVATKITGENYELKQRLEEQESAIGRALHRFKRAVQLRKKFNRVGPTETLTEGFVIDAENLAIDSLEELDSLREKAPIT